MQQDTFFPKNTDYEEIYVLAIHTSRIVNVLLSYVKQILRHTSTVKWVTSFFN